MIAIIISRFKCIARKLLKRLIELGLKRYDVDLGQSLIQTIPLEHQPENSSLSYTHFSH